MRFFLQFSRWFTGILFIISGLIKLNDPVGTQIKLIEYFEVFAEAFTPLFHYLVPITLPLALFFCVFEVVLGLALLLQWRMRLTAWALLLLIGFFTFLTFYSAYFNKVTDCGCFGDAIKLTPWQSFSKDVVLTILIVVIFINRNRMEPVLAPRLGDRLMLGATLVATLVGWWAIAHLPYIDFRAYAIGQNIIENRKLPPGGKPDVYEVRYQLKNEKTGEALSVTDKEYMQRQDLWTDGWTITSTEGPTLVQKGDKAKITDFSVRDEDGTDLTDQMLQGQRLFLIVRTADADKFDRYKEISQLLKDMEGQKQVQTQILTSAGRTDFEALRHEQQLAVPYYYTDGTVLKTISRSDPGLWLVKDGVVKGKWHYNDVPTAAEVMEHLNK